MNIAEIYKIFEQYPNIVTDSRAIVKNCIFIALKGDKFDGNTFAIEALKAGAAYCIIDNALYAQNNKCILVENCLNTLQQLAKFHRQQLGIQVLAITGTNGKTTTKELINAVLSKKFNTIATKGNLNNHIGVPLTLLSIKPHNNFAIVEMGANHIGEIEALCNIAEPNYGIITNIGKAHLEGFGGFEGVIKAKTEMYNYINATKGVIFVNSSNNILVSALQKCSTEFVEYSTTAEAFVTGEIAELNPFLSIKIEVLHCSIIHCTICGGEPKKTINTQLIGSYNLENVLAAVTFGMHFGIEFKHIKEAIENYEPINNRSQLYKSSKNTLLLDYYNANPTSMEAALANFAQQNSQNMPKVVIMGDMFELGEYSRSEHERILNYALSLNFDKIFVVGFEFKKADTRNNTLAFNNSVELANWLQNNPITNSYIFIKGSRGSKLENILSEV